MYTYEQAAAATALAMGLSSDGQLNCTHRPKKPTDKDTSLTFAGPSRQWARFAGMYTTKGWRFRPVGNRTEEPINGQLEQWCNNCDCITGPAVHSGCIGKLEPGQECEGGWT